LLFALVGYFIDNHYQSSPWFTLAGTFLGLLVGFYELVKVIWSNKR